MDGLKEISEHFFKFYYKLIISNISGEKTENTSFILLLLYHFPFLEIWDLKCI